LLKAIKENGAVAKPIVISVDKKNELNRFRPLRAVQTELIEKILPKDVLAKIEADWKDRKAMYGELVSDGEKLIARNSIKITALQAQKIKKIAEALKSLEPHHEYRYCLCRAREPFLEGVSSPGYYQNLVRALVGVRDDNILEYAESRENSYSVFFYFVPSDTMVAGIKAWASFNGCITLDAHGFPFYPDNGANANITMKVCAWQQSGGDIFNYGEQSVVISDRDVSSDSAVYPVIGEYSNPTLNVTLTKDMGTFVEVQFVLRASGHGWSYSSKIDFESDDNYQINVPLVSIETI
jgi:hypothetical protein